MKICCRSALIPTRTFGGRSDVGYTCQEGRLPCHSAPVASAEANFVSRVVERACHHLEHRGERYESE